MQQVWHVGGGGQPIMMMRTHLRGSQGLSAWRAWKLKPRDPKGLQIDVRLLVCTYGSHDIIQLPFKQWFSFCVTQLQVKAFPVTGRLEWNRFPAPQLGLTSFVHPLYIYIGALLALNQYVCPYKLHFTRYQGRYFYPTLTHQVTIPWCSGALRGSNQMQTRQMRWIGICGIKNGSGVWQKVHHGNQTDAVWCNLHCLHGLPFLFFWSPDSCWLPSL